MIGIAHLLLAAVASSTFPAGSSLPVDAQRAAAAPAPDFSNALSAQQFDDAWKRFVMQQLLETPFTGGA